MFAQYVKSIARMGVVSGWMGVLFGCVDEGEGDDEVVGESDTTSGVEAGPSEDTRGTDESTDESSDGSAETSEPDPVAAACADACAGLDACGFGLPSCEADCIAAHALFEGECHAAELAMTQCMGTLECAALQALLESVPGNPGTPCEQEGAALCGVGCTVYSVPLDAGCVVELECGEAEPLHTVQCDGESCSCIIEGEVVGQCELDQAICDMDVSAAEACCGWDLE